jgi:hypothetical protein
MKSVFAAVLLLISVNVHAESGYHVITRLPFGGEDGLCDNGQFCIVGELDHHFLLSELPCHCSSCQKGSEINPIQRVSHLKSQ